MMKKFLVISALLFCSLSAFAANQIISCEAKGQGQTRAEAIENAWYLGVGKLFGLSIETLKQEYHFNATFLESGISSSHLQNISSRSKGFEKIALIIGSIKGYEILEEKELENGNYEVTLKIEAYDYQGFENKDRVRLAIMPFKPSPFANPAMVNLLNQKVTQALTLSNKFAILDREELIAFQREMNVIDSENTSIEEKAKLKEVLGADYMIVGNITESCFEADNKTVDIIGSSSKEYEARFKFSFKVFESPTRIVKYADEIKINLEHSEIKALFDDWDADKTELSDVIDAVYDKASQDIAQKITEQFYPVRILAVDENLVIINNPAWIENGSILSVSKAGEAITDYDTNEKLGQIELPIAKIKVQNISTNIAYAAVIEGNISSISRGDICRRLIFTKKASKKKHCSPSDVVITENNGVHLPFDK